MSDELLQQPSTAVMVVQKPSIGRIVIYHFAAHEFNFNNGHGEAPAIITAAWSDTCVNLKVLADGVHDHWKTSANLGEGPAQWSWPVRVNNFDNPGPQPPPTKPPQ